MLKNYGVRDIYGVPNLISRRLPLKRLITLIMVLRNIVQPASSLYKDHIFTMKSYKSRPTAKKTVITAYVGYLTINFRNSKAQ